MLKLSDYISIQNIAFEPKAESELDALSFMVDLAEQSGFVKDKKALASDLLTHEIITSSARGCCAIVFRVSSESVRQLQIFFTRFDEGIGYYSKSGHPIDLIFLVASPLEQMKQCKLLVEKLENLLLNDQSFREKLRKAESADEVLNILKQTENS